ncbi:MAG: Trk system potassium transporter TrkA [Thermoguttaceae bacterium]|nr:Trk system potassium transporter TrkA [Thermoguttaceae bacterium]
MRVLILGGGTVGSAVAARLCDYGHDVTIVEIRPDVAAAVDSEVDARVLVGNATYAPALFQAGVSTADVCFALTSSDEVNIFAGSVAKRMGASRVAARVYAQEYRDVSDFDYPRHFGIDRFLSLEYLTAMEVARRIREPGAMLIEHFACGELEMQDVAITRESSATDVPLAELKLPSEVRVGAISREGYVTIATANDRVQVGDRVTLLGARPQVEAAKKMFLTGSVSKQNVVIVGGGETGYFVASVLERRNYNVKIVEHDKERCNFLAGKLKNTCVTHGDGRRRNFLAEERVGSSDVFIACAGDDEYNIMSCVEAMELGVKNPLAVIKHPDYASVVWKLGIKDAVSPFEVMNRQVDGLMHKGALVFQNSTLLSGPIEVVELEVGDDSPATKAPLKSLGVPKPTLIAAVVRENVALVPNADFVFHAGDAAVALTLGDSIPGLVELFETPKNAK